MIHTLWLQIMATDFPHHGTQVSPQWDLCYPSPPDRVSISSLLGHMTLCTIECGRSNAGWSQFRGYALQPHLSALGVLPSDCVDGS